MSEGSLFFEGQGAVQQAMRRITNRLEEIGIPYAIVGGMALFQHGFRRFTEDVDILVTPEGLLRIHENLDGRGYLGRSRAARTFAIRNWASKSSSSSPGSFRAMESPSPCRFRILRPWRLNWTVANTFP